MVRIKRKKIIQAEGIPFVIPVQPCATENQVTFGITVVHNLFVCLSSQSRCLNKTRMLLSTKFASAGHRDPRGQGCRACCYPGSRHSSPYLACKRMTTYFPHIKCSLRAVGDGGGFSPAIRLLRIFACLKPFRIIP